MSTSTLPSETSSTLPLTGRVAVVTGASSGIGAAVATALAGAGARVALLARRTERLEELAASLGGADRAIALTADVTDDASVADAAAQVASRLGRVDLVVANAGVMIAADFTPEAFAGQQRMVDLNVTGVLRTLHAFLPAVRSAAADGAPADVVTISSIAAHQRFGGYATYSATKAAVTMLAASLRGELGPAGVRVTNVEPGLVASELPDHVTDPAYAEALEEWRTGTPPIEAEHVGALLAYLLAQPAHVNVPHRMVQPTVQG
jgi:NADP-dependent 3-hydroxy acid dehydrogenase YdfG